MENKKYLTTNDLMERYSVSRMTIVRWRKEGMPSIKSGKIVRFDVEEVDNWFRNRNK